MAEKGCILVVFWCFLAPWAGHLPKIPKWLCKEGHEGRTKAITYLSKHPADFPKKSQGSRFDGLNLSLNITSPGHRSIVLRKFYSRPLETYPTYPKIHLWKDFLIKRSRVCSGGLLEFPSNCGGNAFIRTYLDPAALFMPRTLNPSRMFFWTWSINIRQYTQNRPCISSYILPYGMTRKKYKKKHNCTKNHVVRKLHFIMSGAIRLTGPFPLNPPITLQCVAPTSDYLDHVSTLIPGGKNDG